MAMAQDSVSARLAPPPASADVYTVPAGKTVSILGYALANVGTGDVNITVRWVDASAQVGGREYTVTNAVRVAAGETYYPLATGFHLNENDVLRTVISAGMVDATLSIDITP